MRPVCLIFLASPFLWCSCSPPVRHAGRSAGEWAADLDAESEIVRLRAAKSLGYFGPGAVPHLIQALGNESPGVRYWAASQLGDLGEDAAAAIPALERRFEAEELAVRISIAYALCCLRDPGDALNVLTGALGHPDRGTGNSAAEFLGRIGPRASAAIPALESAAKHEDYHMRGAAVEALRKIRGGGVY